MIKSNVKIHDKFSVVIELTYDKLFNNKKSKYTTITYLFLPESLNINKNTYPSTKFYNDVRQFIKYDTPNYAFDDIYIGENSLLKNLEKNTEKFIVKNTKKNHLVFRDQVKMFAAIFCSVVRDETRLIIKPKDINQQKINELLQKSIDILTEFRKLIEKIKKSPVKGKEINVIFYADEHMSNSIEFQLMKLYNYLDKKKHPKEELSKIIGVINNEQKYKKQKQYNSAKDKNINPDELLYKQNQLKKYIEKVFFLNQEIRRDGVVFEQSILALAAGLAMVFSTGIAFYYQRVYGNFTMPFFITLVISYMLKDRIKGLIGLLFVSRSNSFFYDYKIKITNMLDKKIGMIKENFSFVSLEKLGNKIKIYRLKGLIVGLSERSLNEQIIQYKKRIVIYPRKFGNDLPDEKIIGLSDITRFNFHRFIQYMDDPKKDYILIKKGEVFNKVANKVYHINIIQKYYTEEGIEYNRFRIIINRNGIKRIEKVALN